MAMKTTYSLVILFFLSTIPAFSQSIEFPDKMSCYRCEPNFILIGRVNTVLTSSYRNGNLLGGISVDTYDLNQRLITKISHNAGIEVHSQKMLQRSYKYYYEYEKENRLPITEKSISTDGSEKSKVVYKYENNRIKEDLAYSSNNELIQKTAYHYDDVKKQVDIVSLRYFNGREVQSLITLQYNDNKQWTKRIIYDANGKIDSEVSFEYDDKGLLKKMSVCCQFNYSNTYEYKFDEKGNWIERIELYSQKGKDGKWGKAVESLRTYRVITYFDEAK